MRSSKSRSRSKNNRNNNRSSGGNVVNRVFDSSGPEGKVRGTPQQIIDKYNQLARDAQLSNDRVAAENFQQHAEHYLRLLSEAQREMDQRREQQERENRDRQAQRDRERAERQERDGPGGGNGNGGGGQDSGKQDRDTTAANEGRDPAFAPQPDIVDLGGDDSDSGLVETPENATESKPKPARKPRRKKSDPPAGDAPPSAAE